MHIIVKSPDSPSIHEGLALVDMSLLNGRKDSTPSPATTEHTRRSKMLRFSVRDKMFYNVENIVD